MPFTVSYNITAIDFFSKKIKQMGKMLDKFKGKLKNLGDESNLGDLSVFLRKTMESTKDINKFLSGFGDSIKTDKLSKFNRFLFSTGNIAASAGAKIRNMFPHGRFGKYIGKGAAGLAIASGFIGTDEINKIKLRLAPLVSSMSKVTTAIDAMRMMSIKTGKSFRELSDSYRLLLEGGSNEDKAIKTLKSLTGISYYTNLPMTEFAKMYSKVMEGHGAGEAFRMLLRRGVNLYKPLYSSMYQGKKLSNLGPIQFAHQMQMLNAYVESRAFTLPKFQAVMDLYSHKYMQGMTKKYTETTFSGELSRITASFHQLTTSMGMSITKTLHLHAALNAMSHSMSYLVQRFVKFSNAHPTVAAAASIGAISAIGVAGVKSIKRLWCAFKSGTTIMQKGSMLVKEVFNEFSRFFGLFAKAGALLSRVLAPVATVESLISPATVGDGTLKAYKSITRPDDIEAKLKELYSNKEDKSYVKIDVVAHNADVKSIKKRNITPSVFDVAALGQNQYRLST